MLRTGPKSIITLVAVFTFCTCIDPYNPDLKGYESLLVVDGMITDENCSYVIKLSRTIQEQSAIPLKVSDAKVFITDNTESIISLDNKGDGIYKTDSIEFKGIVGRTYVLHILTYEGEEYESEPCLMQSVTDIDSIYFEKGQELDNNGTENNEGIMIYLDSKEEDNNNYYRWDFEETWKFKIPNPKKYNYINDTTIVLVDRVKEFCWKNRKSDELLIHSVYSGKTKNIEKEPIFFIATGKSDRLLIQYSILVRQYSISKKEFDFWNNMKRINERSGDIFAIQPFPVISNIYNINNPKEQVMGYFQVSSVKQKRKNITFSDIAGLNLPFYHYPCERIEASPKIFPWNTFKPPPTFDELYQMFTYSGYYFVEPKYYHATAVLYILAFAKPECADCELTGTSKKPDFREDLN